MARKSIILGTAGHIDHGKTSLVKALTGIDADRLAEEKRRGITIDLGFAHMELLGANSETLRLGFVDVPGHERFVRNMLAGAGGVDVLLMVIAADEGIKPQTREHFDICRMLAIPRGIIVLTKSDLVDAETLGVVRAEVAEFVCGSYLEGAAIVPVSTRTGAGIDELKHAIARVAGEVSARSADALFRLPIDRVFTIKGHGTVVTGTLISGSVKVEDEVETLPGGKRLRVRGIQVHGTSSERAVAGERTALNLANIGKEELKRGVMLCEPGVLRSTKRIDVELSLLHGSKPLKDRAKVHLHIHSGETIAEVAFYTGENKMEAGKNGFAQLRLKDSLQVLPGDCFIVRQFSPVITIGGGMVLDGAPLKKTPRMDSFTAYLWVMRKGSVNEQLLARVGRRSVEGLTHKDAQAETGWTQPVLKSAITVLVQANALRLCSDVLITAHAFTQSMNMVTTEIESFHKINPLVAGINKDELRKKLELRPEIFSAALAELVAAKKVEIAGEQIRAAGRGIVMDPVEAKARQTIEDAFRKAGLKVPYLKDVLATLPVDKPRAQKIVTLLLRDRVVVKFDDDLAFHIDTLNTLKKEVAVMKAAGVKSIDVGQFKDKFDITRKYAIPLLEYLDRERVTRREGDKRVIL